MLNALLDAGEIERLGRGHYRLVVQPDLELPDLTEVSLRAPRSVICLISALDFHALTTEIPHAVHFAIPRGARAPHIDHPPTRPYWFGPRSYGLGIEEHIVDGVSIRVYDMEKTIVDCFQFRNRIGKALAVEALREYRARRGIDAGKFSRYAVACRVQNVITPYIEALI